VKGLVVLQDSYLDLFSGLSMAIIFTFFMDLEVVLPVIRSCTSTVVRPELPFCNSVMFDFLYQFLVISIINFIRSI